MQEIHGGLPSQALHWVLRNISYPSGDFREHCKSFCPSLFQANCPWATADFGINVRAAAHSRHDLSRRRRCSQLDRGCQISLAGWLRLAPDRWRTGFAPLYEPPCCS